MMRSAHTPLLACRRSGLGLLRTLLVWALVIAMPVHHLSAVINHLLGAQHRHAAVAMLAPSADDTRALAWHDALAAVIGNGALGLIEQYHRQHSRVLKPGKTEAPSISRTRLDTPSAQHAHMHAQFERHYHAPNDDSVVALGDHDKVTAHQGDAGASDSGQLFPLAAEARSPLASPAMGRRVWALAVSLMPPSYLGQPADKPPRG